MEPDGTRERLAAWLEQLGLVDHLGEAGLPTMTRDAAGRAVWTDPGTGADLSADLGIDLGVGRALAQCFENPAPVDHDGDRKPIDRIAVADRGDPLGIQFVVRRFLTALAAL